MLDLFFTPEGTVMAKEYRRHCGRFDAVTWLRWLADE
jgi:hypothetical protein